MKTILVRCSALIYFLSLLFLLLFNRSRMDGNLSLKPHWLPFVHTIQAINSPKPNDFWVLLFTDLLGNVLLFIPFGILGSLLGYNKKKVIFAAFLFSASVELIQFYFRLGVFDANDIILNTLGAFIGGSLLRGTSFVAEKKINQ